MDQVDETVARVRARGPVPLPLDNWDHASIWGWDEATGSLYAHLWRNTDDPAEPPTVRIEPDEYTPAITFPETLAQHIAMAADCDPWDVIDDMDEVVLTQGSERGDWGDTEAAEASSTVVTMTEGHDIWWPPHAPKNSGS
jgi:hypothetical protein